jgi:diacylglycerol kinase (ATP)
MTKLYFIVNPKAGNGRAASIWSKVKEELIEVHGDFDVHFTNKAGHATCLAKEIISSTEEAVTIIVIGGDGTINEVVNGIGKDIKRVRIGVIPGGSGNDFSRGFHIPKEPKAALLHILKLNNRDLPTFDLGKITLNKEQEHFFINSTGAGFDAKIAFEANQSKWKGILNRLNLGQLVYVIFLLKNLFSYRLTTIELMIDDKKYVFPKTWFVTVSNQPFYGGGMKISPHALANDGKLNVTVVHQLSKIKLLLVFLSVFWGRHIHFKEVKCFLGHSVSLYSNESIHVHSDGEEIGFTPLHISIHSDPISIVTNKFTS